VKEILLIIYLNIYKVKPGCGISSSYLIYSEEYVQHRPNKDHDVP